jgi:hypothetical protein
MPTPNEGTTEARRSGPRIARARRPRLARRALATVSALAAVALTGLGVAAAAQLAVTGSGHAIFADQRCSDATLSVHVSPTGFSIGTGKSAVQITNFPAACNGLTVDVVVANGAGGSLATGSATCSGSPCTIPTTGYTATAPTSASVLVGSWGVPASWDSTCTTLWIFMTCS